jgi:thioester reductase-like protein
MLWFIFCVIIDMFIFVLVVNLMRQICASYPESRIFCLVRGESDADATRKLKSFLEKAKCTVDERRLIVYASGISSQSLCDSIILMNADLSLPLFGLSEERWNMLISSVFCIYHNGAQVNLSLPYSALKYVFFPSLCHWEFLFLDVPMSTVHAI